MKIFYVDDEKNNLLLFKRSMPTSFEVIAFIKPKEAAAALEVQKPEVIVTDEDMPELKGLQLLEIASQVLPSSLRFLVTGKTDIDVLQKNTKPGLAHFFIGKPYDPNFVVNRILAHFGMDQTAKVDSKPEAQHQSQSGAGDLFVKTKDAYSKYINHSNEAKEFGREFDDKCADLYMHFGSAIKYSTFLTLIRMSMDEGHTFPQFQEIFWRFNAIKKGE
jgi:response regulator RpfG family c-di-GMP phosphodiesterase